MDEGVQIFGGYGFHEDYPVARAYRDSRVNRIFEGTNEINRMLIIQMLMKRALGGVLPLIPAAMKLGEEVLAGPSFEEAPTGPFAEEEKSLEQAKKIFLLASGTAMQKFREQLAEQQEIVAALANIVMDVYAMESTLRRAQKASGRSRGSGERDVRRRPRLHLRCHGPRRKRCAHGAHRHCRRRYAHHATRRAAPLRETRSARHDRNPPPRRRSRARARSLSV